ncbi:MAG: cutinase family protein [Mycobacteriaceae bacterium]
MSLGRKAPTATRGLHVLLGVAVLLVAVLSAACSSIGTNKPKPAGCPDVQAVFVPGTYETRVGADPVVAVGLLKAVSDRIVASAAPDRAGIYFVPYPAQFTDLANYRQSVAAGAKATTDAMAATVGRCPDVSFTLTGFSQGAAVAGDVATQIGQGEGPVAAKRLLGVGLVSDPNRNPSTEKLIGPAVEGGGLAGARAKDFGAVGDRVVTFCAAGDLICAMPNVAGDPAKLALALAQLGTYLTSQVHSSYGSYKVDSGNTATSWLANWLNEKIAAAPKG